MVQNTRTALHTDTLKPVNLPETLTVKENTSAQPVSMKLNRHWMAVERVEEMWRLDDEWWRPQPLSRLYYGVILISGCRLTIFKDLTDGCWYHQSY
jgi:hypothetical protein